MNGDGRKRQIQELFQQGVILHPVLNQRVDLIGGHRSLPSTVRVTSQHASPVLQEYVPESSGTRLWIRSCSDIPFFLRSYLKSGLMATLFLVHVTVALGVGNGASQGDGFTF